MGTLAETLYEVRRLIGDRRPGDPVCVDTFLEELTDIAVDELSDEIGMGLVKTTNFRSLSVGTSSYTVTLPTGIPSILHLQDLVLQSSGYPLEKKDMAFILAMRVNNSDARGEPRYYAFRESTVSPTDTTRVLTLEVHPPPVQNDAVTAYWEPSSARLSSADLIGSSTTHLPFSKMGLTILRMRVAGKALMALPPESLARLQPPKTSELGKDLLVQSSALAIAEFVRLHAGATPDVIQRTR